MLFQVLELWLATCALEGILFFNFGLTAPEINIKKV